MTRLKNKVAIVTGAAGGQGKAEAKLFAKEGAKVIATDVNHELLLQTVKEINDEMGEECVIAIKHDIAAEGEWADVFSKAMEKFGKVDILVNNAGMPGKTHENVWDIDTTETMRIISVNLVGTLLGIKTVMPEMIKNGAGSIINISSAAGLVGGISGGSVAYSATKAALRAVTKEIAIDVAKKGVRVNTIYPGLVHTPIMDSFSKEVTELTLSKVPMGFPAEPIDLAYAVLFLASDESRFATGADFIIDGGFTAQ
jgi:NAD(P)-dependent dehydrogenase (short-subunit alcohol dehydrogenase family)